jgi:putative transposase
MPMRQRKGMAGHVFHVLNRGVRRQTLFSAPDEYRKFQHLMLDAQARTPLPLLTYCLMSTHFHFVVQPSSDEELPEFMRWLCGTHARRFNLASGTTGLGAVYQARYRALPVQTDAHFLRVCRYVERNPLRAGLVARAEDWRWSGLGQDRRFCPVVPLGTWPVPRPVNWVAWVNQPLTASEEGAIRECVTRSRPYGDGDWVRVTAQALGLERHSRPRSTRLEDVDPETAQGDTQHP